MFKVILRHFIIFRITNYVCEREVEVHFMYVFCIEYLGLNFERLCDVIDDYNG